MSSSYVISRSRDSQIQKKFIYTGIFLVWPFGSALAAIKYYREPMAKNIFWLFCIFFGFTFITDDLQMADSARYVELFKFYHGSNITLKDLWKDLYSLNSRQLDIAQPIITFIVAKIARSPEFLFGTFAFIFGFFYSRNLWYVMERIQGSRGALIMVLLLVLALQNSIWNINNFRFHTAFHIFVYGALRYLIEGRRKYILWSLLSVLVHFTFLLPVAILFGYSFIPLRNINLYFWIFIGTSFIKEIDLLFVRDLIYLLPDVIFFRVKSYTSLEIAEEVMISQSYANWYIRLLSQSVIWTSYAFIIYLYSTGRRRMAENRPLLRLFGFALLIFAFANIASLIPSGGRFIALANFLVFSTLIIYFGTYPPGIVQRLLQLATLPLLLFFIVVTVRVGLDYAGFFTLFGNPFVELFWEDTTPLIDYLK